MKFGNSGTEQRSKIGPRIVAVVAALLVLTVAGLTYSAGDQARVADAGAQNARAASLQSYRIAQSLKALAAGYELTLNEYYSTVLEFSAYQKKATEQKTAIQRELVALAALPDGDAQAAVEITRLYTEIDSYRAVLEKALAAESGKDWDGAREALYKLNVLSVQAIHRADVLGKLALDRAEVLEKRWQADGAQAQLMLNAATLLSVLIAVGLMISAALRPGPTIA